MIRPPGMQAIDGFLREFCCGGRSHMLRQVFGRGDPQACMRLRIFSEPFGEPADSRPACRGGDGGVAAIEPSPDYAGAGDGKRAWFECLIERVDRNPEVRREAVGDLIGRENAGATQDLVAADAKPLGAKRGCVEERRIEHIGESGQFNRQLGVAVRLRAQGRCGKGLRTWRGTAPRPEPFRLCRQFTDTHPVLTIVGRVAYLHFPSRQRNSPRFQESAMTRISRAPLGKRSGALHALLAALVVSFAVGGFFLAGPAQAQQRPESVMVPGFWDPNRRPERPDLSRLNAIRFLTEEDYPPFNFRGPDGQPIGFNVDLARAICNELSLTCTIQVRRFDTLLPALEENRGDAIIASLAITPELRKRVAFTDRYVRMPARFVAAKDFPDDDITPEKIAGRRVALVGESAHEAYLRAFFAETAIQLHPSLEAALLSLKEGKADLVFADGIALAFWLNGTGSDGCCAFRGGPFIDSRYFGEGIGIAVRRENDALRLAINHALFRLWEKGVIADLYLRYFPVGFY
jgi:polar amino acid transport system substrate-binding protein